LSGSYYLSLLPRYGFNVRVANVATRLSLEALAREWSPRFVLLSTTLLFDAAEQDVIPKAVRQIRQNFPDAIVVLGGLMLVRHERPVKRPSSTLEPPLAFDEGYIRWSQLPQKSHLYHTVHTRTARSCAFACAFCEYPVNQGPLTLMPVEAFERELQELRALG